MTPRVPPQYFRRDEPHSSLAGSRQPRLVRPSESLCTRPWSPNVHVFREAALKPIKLDDGLTLWAPPTSRQPNTDNFLDGFCVDAQEQHIARSMVLRARGSTSKGRGRRPNAPFEAAQIERSGLTHAFSGTITSRRMRSITPTRATREPLAFGEDGDRGPGESPRSDRTARSHGNAGGSPRRPYTISNSTSAAARPGRPFANGSHRKLMGSQAYFGSRSAATSNRRSTSTRGTCDRSSHDSTRCRSASAP